MISFWDLSFKQDINPKGYVNNNLNSNSVLNEVLW